jgi:hypothetical protein
MFITRLPGRTGTYLVMSTPDGLTIVARFVGVTPERQAASLEAFYRWEPEARPTDG